MIGTYDFSTMSRSGKSIVAFMPSSCRPGFFGMPLFSLISIPLVVIRAGEEVAAAADQLALPVEHLRAAVGAARHHEAWIFAEVRGGGSGLGRTSGERSGLWSGGGWVV